MGTRRLACATPVIHLAVGARTAQFARAQPGHWEWFGRRLRTTGAPEDVRHLRGRRAGAEAEAAALVDLEPGCLDRRLRVTRRMAAAGHPRPERLVGECRKRLAGLAVGHHVLVEAEV